MRKILSTLLIIVGVGLILTPIVGRFYNDYRQKKMLEEFNKEIQLSFEQTNDELSKMVANPEISEEKRQYEISDVDTNTNQKIDLGTVIGILSIPRLEINLPIMEGTTEKQLSQAIGHLPATAMPGAKGGNCALAGHRGHTFSVFFNRLNEMEVGDPLFIRTRDKMLTYEVYEQKIIDPTDFSILEPVEGESVVTLITCHPLYSDKHRLIVHAKLTEENIITKE